MGRSISFEIESPLAADCGEVWAVVSTMKGVNFELHPFVHMTSGSVHAILPEVVTPSAVVFRSWLLLFGVVPFDRHALAFEQLDVGRGFVEESSSWLQRRWRHERTLTEEPDGGCTVRDCLEIDPRLRLVRPIVAVVVRGLFVHRHRRLRTRFCT